MSLGLGRLGIGLQRGGAGGGAGGIALGRALNLDWATGLDYSKLAITSSSAYSAGVGPIVITNTGVAGKPAGYPGGLVGARVNGSAPAWDDGSGNALSGVTWRGQLPAATTINTYSKPTPGTNGWTLADGATDGGDVPGPDGDATSARRISVPVAGAHMYRQVSAGALTSMICAVIIKGTAGNKINFYCGAALDTIAWQFTLTGGWDVFSLPGTFYAENGLYIVLNTMNDSPARGGVDVTFPQTVDVFMLQVSTGPFPLIQTNGANITRLAETVAYTSPALGAGFSALATMDYSGGLPTAEQDIIASGADKLSVTTGGNVKITDGTNNTTSTAAVTAATGRKVGLSRSAGSSILRIGSTIETGAAAVDWSGDTALTLGGPIQQLSVWTLALAEGQLANA